VKPENEERRIELRIDYNEIELRTRVKEAGGVWKNEKRVWEIGYGGSKEIRIKRSYC